MVTFTPANWNLPQKVTVTGLDDGSSATRNTASRSGRRAARTTAYNQMTFSSLALVNKGRMDVGRFDGSYQGTYSGTVMVPGYGQEPVSGSVSFTVSNGVITVQSPDSGSGTLAGNGDSNFGVNGSTMDGSTFSGLFAGKVGTNDVTASGAWHYKGPYNVIANGSWQATRIG